MEVIAPAIYIMLVFFFGGVFIKTWDVNCNEEGLVILGAALWPISLVILLGLWVGKKVS